MSCCYLHFIHQFNIILWLKETLKKLSFTKYQAKLYTNNTCIKTPYTSYTNTTQYTNSYRKCTNSYTNTPYTNTYTEICKPS